LSWYTKDKICCYGQTENQYPAAKSSLIITPKTHSTMKYLLLSLLLTTTSLQAQNTDFAPVGAKWIYNGVDFALQGVPYTMEVTGKENFEGKWCSR
jgi:hypothetical protein